MKRPIHTYVFTPTTAQLDLSSIAGFDVRNLFAVLDLATGALIYAPTPALGYSAIAGSVLTLKAPMAGLSATDPLIVLYDDGGKPAEDASVQGVVTSLGTDGTGAAALPGGSTGVRGLLRAIRELLSGNIGVTGTFWPTTQPVSVSSLPLPGGAATAAAQPALHADGGSLAHVTNLPATQPISAAALPLPAGAAQDGTDITGSTMPAGGAGIRGWLSACYGRLQALVTATTATQPRSIASNAPSVSQTGNLSALNDAVVVACDGMNTAVVQLAPGPWSGTAIFEASADNQASWSAVNMVPYASGPNAGSFSSVSAGGLWEMACGGLTHVRVRASTAITSGPAAAIVRATNGLKSLRVGAPAMNPVPTTGTPSTVGDGVVTGGATGTPSVATAGGAASHSYVPGEVLTMTGGTSTTPTQLTVATTGVTSATVASGGTGGTAGTQTVTGTTGTGTKFTASVTVASGAITAVNSISLAGAYTVNPSNLAAEPVTGGGLTGATLTIVMGVASATISTPGVYSAAPSSPVAQASSTGAGTGATFTLTYVPIAQTILGGVAPLNGWKVNCPSLSGDLWVSDNGIAPSANGPSSYRVFSGGGGQYSTEAGEKPSGFALKLLGTTIGQAFIARSW